jgi:hypothetical protein
VEHAGPRKLTPIALKPIVVWLAHEIQSASSYTSIIATPDLLVELFDCDADAYAMEGLWVQKLKEQGQIYALTVYLRPRSLQRLSALFPGV